MKLFVFFYIYYVNSLEYFSNYKIFNIIPYHKLFAHSNDLKHNINKNNNLSGSDYRYINSTDVNINEIINYNYKKNIVNILENSNISICEKEKIAKDYLELNKKYVNLYNGLLFDEFT